jgi:hypothetical protein
VPEYAFEVGAAVVFRGRPAVVIASPIVGATGATLYGVRFTDCERFEPCPGFPGMLRPTAGSSAIARSTDLEVS